ncbi:xanthine dehydrogenase family protein molybdopterin-binding subunit [bacterium CPR1]|nr:xanthine dehydrogenase family protein molybdopterin-binding subunit [bacterium CPR1]
MTTETRWIGARVPKLDAPAKATGQVRYLSDLSLPGMLHGKIRRSDRPHARIVTIDIGQALAVPGVHAVLTARDIDNVAFGHGNDNNAFKNDIVRCIRDEIAAVAAETEEAAERACRAIQVTYEDLPAIFDPREALQPGAPVLYAEHPDNRPFTYSYGHGSIEQGEAESAFVVDNEFELTWVNHCCMGVSAILASFDAEGRLTLHSQTQVPFLYRRDMAAIVGMDPADIRVIQPTIGGAFGSKLDIYPFEPIAVHLARATRRPVRIVFSRQEEFRASPTRQPAIVTLRTGCDRQGRLTFRDAHVLLDNGGHTSWGATIPFVMMQTVSSLYRVPHVRFACDVVYTNNPYSGSFRGYGNLQATFAVEQQVDMLAERCGLDPLEIRRLNAQHSGEETGQGLVFSTCGLKDCLDSVARQSDWAQARSNREAGAKLRRGVGVAGLLHVGGGAKIYRSDGCGSILSIDDFGKATLVTGSSDIGQGSETVLAQIVAEVLGIDIARVRVINDDTDVKPWDVGVHASRTSYVAGNSALMAARQARDKLLGAAARSFQVPLEELSLRDGSVMRGSERLTALDRLVRSLHFSERAELLVTQAYFEPASVKQDSEFRGNVSPTYAFAAQVAEVEVELDTGVVRVVRVSAAHDVGKVLNALGLEGQIEGGIVMGMGYALSEELKIVQGMVLNPSFRDYHIPTAPEVPEIRVEFIETLDPTGPFGAKGVGEAPAICLAAAIANAVYHATGVRFTRLPLTPERVLEGLIAAGLVADLGASPCQA